MCRGRLCGALGTGGAHGVVLDEFLGQGVVRDMNVRSVSARACGWEGCYAPQEGAGGRAAG